MQRLIDVKERIRTVENIRTVTRTLATVSSAKLASSRRRASGLRVYAREMADLVFEQQKYLERCGVGAGAISPLIVERAPVENIAVFVITADRGMCGGYNLAICRAAMSFAEERTQRGQHPRFITRGRRGERYFGGRHADVIGAGAWRRGGVRDEDVEEELGRVLELFLAGSVEEVHVAYTEFCSPIRREPRIARLLPIVAPPGPPHADSNDVWMYEPGFREVFDPLIHEYLRVRLADVLIESYASEQAARMITMEEATERAEKTLREWRVRYNRLRREAITTDLIAALQASNAVSGLRGRSP